MNEVPHAIDPSMFRPLLDAFVASARNAWGDQLVSIVLYGSVARGQPNTTSDVDILLVIRNAPLRYWKRLKPLAPIFRQLQQHPSWKALEAQGLYPTVNVLILSQAEARKPRPLYLDMVDEARLLVDQGGFFAHRLSTFRARMRRLGTRKIRRNGTWYWDLKPDLRPGEALRL